MNLPSWVNFPDFERVGWLNSVMGRYLAFCEKLNRLMMPCCDCVSLRMINCKCLHIVTCHGLLECFSLCPTPSCHPERQLSTAAVYVNPGSPSHPGCLLMDHEYGTVSNQKIQQPCNNAACDTHKLALMTFSVLHQFWYSVPMYTQLTVTPVSRS